MTVRHRSFVSTETPRKAPITFDIGGLDSQGEEWIETFHCISEAPVGVLDDLISSVTTDRQGNMILHNPSILALIRGVLVEEGDDIARFEALVRDKNRVVSLEQLGEVVMWLSEELVGHPSQPRSGSATGPRHMGRTTAAS